MRTSSLTNSTKRFKKVNHIFENFFSVNENTDFINIQIKNVDTIKSLRTSSLISLKTHKNRLYLMSHDTHAS